MFQAQQFPLAARSGTACDAVDAAQLLFPGVPGGLFLTHVANA